MNDRNDNVFALLYTCACLNFFSQKRGMGERRSSIPLLFSLPLDPLPLSTPSTQANYR